MEIVAAILSSAVVSGIVSIVLTSVLENKKYIRDKKYSIYCDFLDQLDKLLPSEDIATESSSKETLLVKLRLANFSLEKHVWKVKLITGDKVIIETVEEIFSLTGDLLDEAEKEKDNKFDDIFEKLNLAQESLIQKMNSDLNKSL